MRRMLRCAAGLSGLLLVLLLVAAGSANAQPLPWEPVARTTPGWVVTPGIVVGTLRDNNVTLRNQGDPQIAAGELLFNPRSEIDFNGRQTHFNAGYSGSLEAYHSVSELNRYEQRGRLGLKVQSSPRLQFFSTGSLTVTPTTDRLELGAGSLPFVNVGSRLFDAGGGAVYAFSPKTTLQAEYRFQRARFDHFVDTPNGFLTGGDAQSPRVAVMHAVTERLSVGGAWQYRTTTLVSDTERFSTEDTSGEVALVVGPNTSVNGGFGAAYVHSTLTAASSWGPAFHVGIDHQVGRTTVRASYQRSFLPSFTFGGLTANQMGSLSAHVPLPDNRWYVDGGLSYGRTAPVEAIGVGYQLDSLFTSASVGYSFSRVLRVEGFYTGSHQTSTARGDIDRTRIGIQFVTSAPVRIE